MLIEKEEIEKDIKNVSSWVLRLVLNMNKITINISDIAHKIKQKIKNIIIINTLEYEDRKEILIRLKCTKDMDPKDKEKIKSYEYLKLLEDYLLNLKINGIESVKKVFWKEEGKVKYGQKQEDEIVFETEGINLLKIFEIEDVDFKKTISNDINEIFKTLGIEAARKTIIEEIRKVLMTYGIYINYRHISLLSDLMSHRGFLTSITRFGLKKTNVGPIRNATFEETANNFLKAAIFNQKDELNGISEKILLGKDGKFGTHCFDLVYPNEEENKSKNINDEKQMRIPDSNNSNQFNDKSNQNENKSIVVPENPPNPSSPYYESPKPQEITGTSGFLIKDKNNTNISQYIPSLPKNLGENIIKKNKNATPFIRNDKNEEEEEEEEDNDVDY